MASSGDIGTTSIKNNAVTTAEIATAAGITGSQLAANTVDKDRLALGLLQYQQTNILSAAVLTLNTVPVVLVPAPGAGLMVLVQDLLVTYVYNSTTYACNAAGASLFYGATAAGQACGITVTQAFIQLSSGTNFAHVRGNGTLITDVTANLANAPVAIKASTTDPTTGNGILKFMVWYRVVAVPLT